MLSRWEKQQPVHQRRAFTLVELLVAVTIFIILTTLTIGAFNYNIGSERITAASRQVQASLEGAKSRAFGMSVAQRRTAPVGIRFIIDEKTLDGTSPSRFLLVKSLMYIQGVVDRPRGYLEYVEFPSSPPSPPIRGIRFRNGYGDDPRSWYELASTGFLQGGVKIRVDNGRKEYTISSEGFLPGPPPEPYNPYRRKTLRVYEEILDVAAFGDPADHGPVAKGTVTDYELDLTSIAIPIDGVTIAELPAQTAIDITNSKVPSAWYQIGPWKPSHPYKVSDQIVFRSGNEMRSAKAITTGTSSSSIPSAFSSSSILDTVSDGGVIWQIYPTVHLDIMFSPQGPLMGKAATEGLIHLLLTERIDAEAIFENDPTAGGATTASVTASDLRDRDGDGVGPDHRGSFRVITINANSGDITVSPVDFTPRAGNPNIANDIFNLARQGAEAK